MIKKISIFILSIILSLTCITEVNAASGTISITSSASTVVVGNTFKVTVKISSSVALGSWQYTISYDSNKVKLQSGTSNVVDYGDGQTKSKSYTYTFKALSSGSANITVKSYRAYAWDESLLTLSAGSKTVKLITQDDLIASYSKDNKLKSITVGEYALTPAFNPDTLEYTVSVPSNIEKITLNAEVNDRSATLTGTGEKEVSEGDNIFELLVTAENGSQRKYKVNIKVEDPSPITVETTNGKSGTIVKRASTLTKPNTFTETTIDINGEEIPAFVSDITKLTLVGIKIEGEEEVGLYIYDKISNSYTPYKELNFNSVIIYPKEYDEYPENYKKYEIELNGETITGYKISENSDFFLIYGLNIETGDENIYRVDTLENTISRYTFEEQEYFDANIKNLQFIIIVLGIESIILLIILICVLISKNKSKNLYKRIIKDYESKHHKENKNEEKNDIKPEVRKDKDNKEEKKEDIKIEKIETEDINKKKKKKLSDTQKLNNL